MSLSGVRVFRLSVARNENKLWINQTVFERKTKK